MNMVRKALGIGVIGVLAALMVVSLASAQPGGGGAGGGGGRGAGGAGGAGGGGGGGRGMGGMGRGGFGMVTQESLGATAEEWKVLEPKVTAVQTLNQQLSGRGGMRRGGQDTGAAAPAETEVSKARTALMDLVGPNATGTPAPEAISKALTALRQARDKAKTALATAQADLKKVVTPKQEAILVLGGLLD
jgi:hypothetical protein